MNLNRHLAILEDDYLYHISLEKSERLRKAFSDVKFVCMGGSPKRMHQFAHYIKEEIGFQLPIGVALQNISEESDRYAMYKIGPVISVNHGIGCPSISILLNELIKLIHYAGCKDVTFFRIGTCGGVGVEPGTIVVTSEAVDGMFRPEYRQIVLGKEQVRKTKCDERLVQDIVDIGKKYENKEGINKVTSGKTLCANDFYEGQGRLDGAFCDYTAEEKMEFLRKCKDNGVKNIEMESLCFTGLLNHANIRGAVICVTLVDRLNGDQVVSHDLNLQFQERPFKLVAKYIKQQLSKN